MYNLAGYLFIFFLILLLGAFFAISMQCDYRRIKKRVDREIKKIDILNQMIKLKEQIDAKSAKYLKEGTFEYLYLSQIDAVLYDNPFQLDRKRVSPINFRKSDDNIKKEAFLKFLQNVPACVKKDMDALSEILGNIYKMQHPAKYKIMQVKKIMVLQILKILIVFCSFMIKTLEKRTEDNTQKKIKKYRIQQIQAKNRPSSVLLNIHSESDGGLLQAA